jgi:pilus assembly protein FimV
MARFSRWFVILAFVLVPASVSALGLGDIKLNSYLNERLNAEISISVAGAEELETLDVRVASREAFERFGVERVDFMDDLDFTVDRLPDGRAVVRVTSSEAIVEPFVTFLIEARSSGGRLLREYTVLLDPPLFLPEPEEPAEAPAAPVRQAPSAGSIPRATQPSPVTASRPQVASATTYGPVRRNETLWGIAANVRPDAGVSMNQAMISLFRANPDAFDGNINRLREGATLRVPDYADMTGLSVGEASAEVRQHNRDWKQARVPSAAPVAAAAPREPRESRLELVPPDREERAQAPTGASASTAPPDEYIREQEALNEELLGAVQSLRRELEETRRLMELKDDEIAALQDRLAGIEAGRFQPAPEVPVEEEVPAAPPEDAAAAGAEQPVAAEPEPTPVEEQPVAAPTPPPAQIAADTDEGGLFSSIWMWIVIVVVALLGAAVYWRQRQEQADEAYESWATVDQEGRPVAAAAGAVAPAADIVVEEPAIAEVPEEEAERTEPQLEEEAADIAETAATTAEPLATEGTGEYAYPFEDTIAGATGINLDQSDPLAEADFHMAYGLYDQAADLVEKAIERDPDRIDLRTKLLDILFVWGQQDAFLEEAIALQAKIGGSESAEWERIAIMGRQICPDAAIFGQEVEGELAAASGGDVDFDLSAGQAEPAESDGLDFDLGATGEMPGVDIDVVDESIAPDSTAEVEIEDLGLDIDIAALGEEVEEAEDEARSEAVVEESVEDTAALAPVDEEQEEDTGLTEVLDRIEEAPSDDDTGLTDVLDRVEEAPPSEETGLTEVLERVEAATEDETAVVKAEDLDIADLDSEGTKELPALDAGAVGPEDETAGDLDTTDLDSEGDTREMPDFAGESDDDTVEVEIGSLAEGGLDLDLSELTSELEDDLDKTAELPIAGAAPDANTLMDEVFGDDESEEGVLEGVAEDEGTKELPVADFGEATLSEVGTKLDLARAYIDMGDPAGARTILEEVVSEGDEGQKVEAQQLLEGLG